MTEEGENKDHEYVLDAIDQLRHRKARPDRDRISHMVARKHGLTFDAVHGILDRMVTQGIVIKVDYKGSTSYRNAAKWKRNPIGGAVAAADDTSVRLYTAVRALRSKVAPEAHRDDRQAGAAAMDSSMAPLDLSMHSNGASLSNGTGAADVGPNFKELESWLLDADCTTTLVGEELETALAREVEMGRIVILPGGKLGLGEPPRPPKARRKEPPRGPEQRPAPAPRSLPAQHGGGHHGLKHMGKRKRFKKNLGPDFETFSPIKQSRYDGEQGPGPIDYPDSILTCDFCLGTGERNQYGQRESLLICKDCKAKAHPSCMQYTDELARRARRSPWQCIECKTCAVCTAAGDPVSAVEDPDAMLFCDACDKGYHMGCHHPPLDAKPEGAWMCSRCETDEQTPDADTPSEPHMGTASVSDEPTPSDSPVSFAADANSPHSLANGFVKMAGEPPLPLPRLAASLPQDIPDAADWTIDDVCTYLIEKGFAEQAQAFREQEIDGKSLLLMKRSDVLTGLCIKLGPALKIYAHVQRLQSRVNMRMS